MMLSWTQTIEAEMQLMSHVRLGTFLSATCFLLYSNVRLAYNAIATSSLSSGLWPHLQINHEVVAKWAPCIEWQTLLTCQLKGTGWIGARMRRAVWNMTMSWRTRSCSELGEKSSYGWRSSSSCIYYLMRNYSHMSWGGTSTIWGWHVRQWKVKYPITIREVNGSRTFADLSNASMKNP